MNSFELNKIFGAILGALVFVMGVGFIAEAVYHPIENRGATYLLPEPEPGEGEGPAQVAEIEPIAVRMQTASAEAGERLMNRCQSCHDYSPDNANRTGPGIYGVMGEVIAHHDDFNYSDIFVELREAGEMWDYENMDAFLTSPRNFAPGTRMTFAGLSSPEDRANLIAFLRTLASDPIPLPEAPAEGAPDQDGAGEQADGDQAEAEGETPAADAPATEDGAPVVETQEAEPGPGDAMGADGAQDEGTPDADAPDAGAQDAGAQDAEGTDPQTQDDPGAEPAADAPEALEPVTDSAN